MFLEAGGFDTTLATYGGEDYELGCRLQKMGARFRFLPDAEGVHYAHENKTVAAYLARARSVGRNDAYIVNKHPEFLDRLNIGLVTRPRTALGRIARLFAFDCPQWGDPLVRGLGWISWCLEGLRARHAWNRLIDSLYQYWYFRGVSDALGNARATVTSLAKLHGTHRHE